MKTLNLVTLIFSGIFLLLTGCSGNQPPVTTGIPIDSESGQGSLTSTHEASVSGNNHVWLSYNLVYVNATDPQAIEFEIVPLHTGAIHLNILKLLEVGLCTNCFQITGWTVPTPGVLDVDIRITHPLPDLKFSVFDLRGIMMFGDETTFYEAGLSAADPSSASGGLINSDGYTTLYNASTIGVAPNDFTGYFQGKMASAIVPDADLNGYIRHNSADPGNNRNAFFAADSVTETYSIALPSPEFILGYAVDANWAEAIADPVTDPITDFGIDANCPEPWKIIADSTPIESLGDLSNITIDIYDWEGSSTYSPPVIECPELFTGSVTAMLVSEEVGYTRFETFIMNANGAPIGDYRCLISVEADENDPVGAPWMDLTAYQIIDISVNGTFILQDLTPDYLNFGPREIEISGNYAFIAASFNGLQIFDITDPENPVWFKRIPMPSYAVQLTIEGGYAYVVTRGVEDIQIVDIDPVAEAYLVGGLSVDNAAWAVDSIPGYLYVSSSTYPGSELHIFDLADPEAPVLIKTVITSTPGFARSVVVENGYAYTANALAGVEIIDVDPPETAIIVGVVIVPDQAWSVVVSGAYAFIAGGVGGLVIADIDPPETANIINTVPTTAPARWISISGNYAFVACQNYGLDVAVINPPAAAAVVQNIPGEFDIENVTTFGTYAYAGGLDGGFHVLDISTPGSSSIVNTLFTPCGAYGGLEAEGDYIYATSNSAGLMILDASVLESTYVLNVVKTGNANDVAISGNYAYVVDLIDGVVTIDISIPGSESIVSNTPPVNFYWEIVISGDYAYVAASIGLIIFDISGAPAASLLNIIPTPDYAVGVAVEGSYAYVLTQNLSGDIIEVINIDPPTMAAIEHTLPVPESALRGIDISGDYAYIGLSDKGLLIVNISTPAAAFIENSMATPDPIDGLVFSAGYTFMCGYNNGLIIADVEPPDLAFLVDSIDTQGYHFNIAGTGNHVYLGAGPGGIKVIRLY